MSSLLRLGLADELDRLQRDLAAIAAAARRRRRSKSMQGGGWFQRYPAAALDRSRAGRGSRATYGNTPTDEDQLCYLRWLYRKKLTQLTRGTRRDPSIDV